MVDIKLPQIPDRTPVKLTVMLLPDLHRALGEYAAFYAQAYGREEPVAELIPAMLAAFLESDRGFLRDRDSRQRGLK